MYFKIPILYILYIAVSCGEPDNGTFSMIVGIYGIVYLNSVHYECITGHGHLSGDIVRNCQQNGSWSGSPLVCESELFYLHTKFLIIVFYSKAVQLIAYTYNSISD